MDTDVTSSSELGKDNTKYLYSWVLSQLQNAYSIFDEHFVKDDTFRHQKIVSVGCGACLAEYMFQKYFKIERERMIMVDPDPNSYSPATNKKLYLEIDYPTVDKLVQSKPEIVGDCLLILWNSETSFAHYDLEAVRKLKPNRVLIATDLGHSINSYLMHYWLDSIGLSKIRTKHCIISLGNMIKNPSRWFPTPGTYTVGQCVTWTEVDGVSKRNVHYSIVLLKKSCCQNDSNNFDSNFDTFVAENKQKIDEVKMFSEQLKKTLSNFF